MTKIILVNLSGSPVRILPNVPFGHSFADKLSEESSSVNPGENLPAPWAGLSGQCRSSM